MSILLNLMLYFIKLVNQPQNQHASIVLKLSDLFRCQRMWIDSELQMLLAINFGEN